MKDISTMKEFYKKIIKIFILVGVLIFLVSCAEMTDFEKQNQYLKEHNGTIYSYISANDSLINLNYNNTFSKLEDIIFSDFTAIVINIDKYNEYLDVEFMESLYQILFEEKLVIIMFVGYSDYDFIENTKFGGFSSDYNNRGSTILSYCNFTTNENKASVKFSYVESYEEDSHYSFSVVTTYARAIHDFITVQ